MSLRRPARIALGLALLAATLLAALVAWLNVRGEEPLEVGGGIATPAQVERGAYLARAGNCAACHTDRGEIGRAHV